MSEHINLVTFKYLPAVSKRAKKKLSAFGEALKNNHPLGKELSSVVIKGTVGVSGSEVRAMVHY